MAPVYTLSLMTKFLNLIWYAWTFVDMIFCRSFHMCTPKNNRSKCYMGEYRLSSLTLTRLSSLCLVFASLIFKLLVLSRGKKVWFIYNSTSEASIAILIYSAKYQGHPKQKVWSLVVPYLCTIVYPQSDRTRIKQQYSDQTAALLPLIINITIVEFSPQPDHI